METSINIHNSTGWREFIVASDNTYHVIYFGTGGCRITATCIGCVQVKDFVAYLISRNRCLGKPHIRKQK